HGVGAVDVGPQLHGGPGAEVDLVPDGGADPGADGLAGVELLDVGAGLQHVGDDETGLGQVRGAGDVGDHSPGGRGVERGGEQVALQGAELSHVGGAAAPAGLGAAAQGAQARAGHVREHPGEAARELGADAGAVGGAGGDLAARLLQGPDGPLDELGAVRLELDGQQVGVVVDGQP